jgi:hypothetical protein
MIFPCFICGKKLKTAKNSLKHTNNHILNGGYAKAMENGTPENRLYIHNLRMFRGVLVPPEISENEKHNVKRVLWESRMVLKMLEKEE